MRPAVLALALVAAGTGCRHAPDEPVTEHDSGSTESPASRLAPEAGAADSAAASPRALRSAADGGPPEVSAFCEDAFGADAERLRAKCSTADLGVSEAVAHAAANLCSGDVASALARGRATFDATAARRCVDMLHAQPMTQSREDDTFFLHAPCDRVLVGTQAEGGPCRFSVECGDGLACVGYRSGTDGVCKKPPRAGETCSIQAYATILNGPAAALHHAPCAHGAWCDGAVCQPRAGTGKSCKFDEACAEGLACARGRCAPRASRGRACAASADCMFGLWCDRTDDAGVAGKCADKRAEGQACTAPDACKGRCDFPGPDAGGGGGASGVCASVCGSG
jgi:hypothetical protein